MAEPFLRPASMAEALSQHAALNSDRLALRFLGSSTESEAISYGQLDAHARRIATTLAHLEIGARVVLLLPSGLEYVASFFGCLYASLIAVPAYPPESTREQHLQRLRSIIADAQPSAILTIRSLADALPETFRSNTHFPQILLVDEIDESLATDQQITFPEPQAIAFLQYTSGSTSAPKGVQVSHANLEANEWLIRQGYGIGDNDVIVSWLPLYHDMGLIGGLLQGIYSGVPVVLMSPQYFLERPIRWLEAISTYGGTISGGPDFAYRLCHERIAEEKISQLNLSSWRVAFSGAEPIRQDSLAVFAEKFSRCDFRPSAFLASYGLAEATLFVTGGKLNQGIPALRVDAQALSNHRVEEGADTTLMSCGWEQPEHPFCIVDPQSSASLVDDCVGEIWASGPSIAQGYWRRPEETEAAFVQRDGRTWLRTGDLGFRHEGELFVTGRIKDMLIIRGHNLYPQDVERTVETDIEFVRKGRVAAFSVQNQSGEVLAVAAEVSRKTANQFAPEILIGQIRRAVAEAHHESPSVVILLNPGALPKTSSGKLQRSACRAQLDAGTLDAIAVDRDGKITSISPNAIAQNDIISKHSESSAPRENIGEEITALWKEFLKLDSIGANDNFFVLGGNSVLAIQLIAELRDRLQISLELQTLFEAQTLAAFSHAVESNLATPNTFERIAPISRTEPIPQSPAQSRLWFLWQTAPDSAAYNIPGGLRLRGDLDEEALRAAFAALIARHESLRTTFYEENEKAFQRVHDAIDWQLSIDDLRDIPIAEREASASEIRECEAVIPFDLENGPLLRIRLIKLDDQDHVLIVTLHHIIADGWSLDILLKELAQIYSLEAQSSEPVKNVKNILPLLSIQYADYAAWCRSEENNVEKMQQFAYWRDELREPREALALPFDRTVIEKVSVARRVEKRLPKVLSEKLRALAKTHGVAAEAGALSGTTSAAVLLTAFQALLHRWCGNTDIRIGIPNANRLRRETQSLVGFFINTQVMRANVEAQQGFDTLLAITQQALQRAHANQSIDFERVAAALQSDAPLFEVMFNHQYRDSSALRRLPGLLAEELSWHSREAKFPLQLHVEENEKGDIRLAFDYAVDAFDRLTIENIAHRYVQILEQICDNTDTLIGNLNLLDHEEREQLTTWGKNTTTYPAQLLPELLRKQSACDKEAIAIIDASGDLTGDELHQRSNALAHQLREQGVGPDVCVGVAIERSLDLMVILLAIIKAGGAYVPLDREYPRERLSRMIRDSNIAVLLGDAAFVNELEVSESVTVLAIENISLQETAATAPALDLHADNLAYVIFTSGTTGTPKAVGISHGALTQRLQWMREGYRIDSSDVLLQKAPLGFDVSVWECFLPLISGARLVLAGIGEQRDPKRLVELVRTHNVTTLHFVPPMLQLFIDEPDAENCKSLRRLFSGGEVLPVELVRRVHQRLPQVALHNRYGPTETAINVTHWPCDVSDENAQRIAIGRPLANVVCELRDDSFALAPIGAQAELLLGGAGLARGYLGNAAQTAQRFIPTENGQRLYRSGDRARWRYDGVLEYLGRNDSQIKLRGFRIELEEIRHCLLQQSAIDEAVVAVRESQSGAQLIAYLCCADNGENESEFIARIKAALQQFLPDYMVPAHFAFLDRMPLTPSGKLDHRALPEPIWQIREYLAPRDAQEETIAAIWCEVIGCERVGLNDDFFALGGHSLLATRIVSRTRQAFDIELPLRSLFEHNQFSAFSQCVTAVRAAGVRDSYGDIDIVDRAQHIPLSYSQQRMWFLWQFDPLSPAYNVGGAAIMRGNLDIDCFERALNALIERHETLRTTFPSEQGKPYQQVIAHAPVDLQRLDFSQTPANELPQRLQNFSDEQAHQPFDLALGPLLKICLIKTAAIEHHLVVTLHHIVTEGWAMDIFARELAALYDAFLQGKESPLVPLRVQYLDYSVWQCNWLESGEMQRQLDYWKQQLGSEQPLLELPADRPRPAEQSYRGDLLRFNIDAELSSKVRRFNTERGLTLFTTVTTALALLLYRYSGQSDLRIGVPVANRIRPESEGLIGAFLNTQVLRICPDAEMRGEELLEQVRQVSIEAQSHQDVPFDQLVDALQPQRSAAYNPLFQVMCNVQRWEFQQSREIAGGVKIEYVLNDARATKFDLNLEVTDIDQQLHCCFTYSSDLFDRARIERMARHWQNLLRALIENPDEYLSEVSLLDADEYRTLIRKKMAPAKTTDTVPSLFEQRVQLSPQALALTFKNESLTYAELNARANRLAHRLRELGIGPEQRVGLALPRSFDMVVGLLAILKAGGAYVPLDPEYPRDRLRYMIEDSGITLLLMHTSLIDELTPLPQNVIALNLDGDAVLDGYSSNNLERVNTADHLAYLIYTSGSTGKPKGVAVMHGPLAMHCLATGELFEMRPDDCELHFYSINFDAASERLLVPLLFGARVVLREQGQWDAEPICDLIREQGVTVLGFTPSYGRQLARWLDKRDTAFPVRLCITGGEALTAEHVFEIRNAFAPNIFFNAYGPTETVVMPLAYRVPYSVESNTGIAIGTAVGERDLYVLDANLALLPRGVSGELFIGGEGIARGYHMRASLSAEKFIANPFTINGDRLYRTGDWVRQRADGTFDYLGRIDQQVKIRGFRIELGEIETQLQKHEAVRECTVIALDGAAGKQLAAYVVPVQMFVEDVPVQDESDDQLILRAALQSHLRLDLPEYMVPGQWVFLDRLPLTANGKLDRAALPAPSMEPGSIAKQLPRTPVEVKLAEIWRDVLNISRVGIDQNFFELGGDSILSIQVVSRSRQHHIHFTAKDLFRHQTIRSLAAAARAEQVFAADQNAIVGAALLTPIQQWFFELGAKNPQHWNQSLLFESKQPLNADSLRAALRQLVAHHDALRQRFIRDVGDSEKAEENAAQQWLADYRDIDNAQDFLLVFSTSNTADALPLFEAAQRSLDLETGPLLRAVLIEGEPHKLLLMIHHLAVDGVSWRILLDDLQTLYWQIEAKKAISLPAKTTSPRQWAAQLHNYARSDSLRDELRWWQSHLSDAPSTIPCDRVCTENLERDASRLILRLNGKQTRQLLERAPHLYRSSVVDLLLIALARALCRWSGESSALIEIENHGREESLFDYVDLSRSVGWFTSTYPVCLTPEKTLSRSITAIKEQLRAVPHKGIGYGVLRYLGDGESRAALRSLPQARVTFNYLGQLDTAPAENSLLQLVDEAKGDQHDSDTPLPNWLSIDSQVLHGELQMQWTFSKKLFDRETISRLAADFRQEIKTLNAHCLGAKVADVVPGDFPLAQLTQEQLDKLPIPAEAIDDIYPLTPMQEGLLLHTLLEPGTGIYFMQDRYRIDSEINVTRFDRAWRAVIARHEALRASFCWNSGERMLQIIHRKSDEAVEFLDWSDLPAQEHEQRLQELLKEEREAGFDLLEKPPFRLRLIRLNINQHWFIMSNHHILIDAWCRSILMSDFLEIYAALKEKRDTQLDAPPRYRDFIAWLHAKGLCDSSDWWKRQLAGFERASFIPSDRPFTYEKLVQGNATQSLQDKTERVVQGMRVADSYSQLLIDESTQLRELARNHQLTINTFAQAAWALVLLRYGRERDVLFGVTVAGRPASLPEMQRTVGLFINTVPLRVPMPAFAEKRSVKQWLRDIFEHNLEMREHEHVPLVTIQECSELPQGQPLFDSLFVFENAPVEHSVLDRARVLKATSDSGRTHTNYPLTVVCYPGDALRLHLSYDQRFFETETIERLLEDFRRSLLALMNNLDNDFGRLPLLDSDEQHFLIDECNRTQHIYLSSQGDEAFEKGYAALFEERVAAHPERCAARCMEEAWTYRELDRNANRLAHQLIAAGVTPDQPVMLLAERSLPLLGMIIATFKAGAGYVPLDPAHPLQRLQHISSASRANVLICSEAQLDLANEILESSSCSARPVLLVWEEVQKNSAAKASDSPRIPVSSQHLAYVIYTSGSTGLPKGVAVQQAGMLNNQLSKIPYMQLCENDVIAQTASQCFDISVWQFLTASLCGACVEIVPDTIAHNPAALLQHVRDRNISILESVPSLIQGMLNEEGENLNSLRCLLPTGEAMPPDTARQWLQRYPQIALINAYGPAECSDDVALFQVHEEATHGAYLPIGTPTDNNRLYLLDAELQPIPVGAIGELCVAGTGVGRGYIGDKIRTAQSFLPYPFASNGERLYRTGDLARQRADGIFEYVGRADYQVKIRGYRIELGEIESRLHALSEVRTAAVVVQENAAGKHLIGYVVPSDATLLTHDASAPAQNWVSQSEFRVELQTKLRAALPDYMVPAHWFVLDSLPLNTNGKLDRKALPLFEFDQLQHAYAAPRNELERTLAQIWADVLKAERVGIHDDFFSLGGHSLLATQIASRVQRTLQRNVPLRAMFECSTVAELASYIESLDGSDLNAQKTQRLDSLMSRLEAL